MKKEIKAKKTKKVQIEITPEIRAFFDGYHKETKQEMDRRTSLQDEKREREMRKYIAELNKKSDEDIKRYIGSLTEEYQGRVSAVAEQFSGLNEKVDSIKETLDEHGRILKIHTEMIGSLMETTEEIKEELKNKTDKTETIRLSRRVSVLEHHV